MMASVNSVSQMANPAARRHRPSQPAVFSNDAALITATHSRPVQYSQDHAYGQEAPTPPRSFLAEGPRASRALSASRASSSPNSTGSSPTWPSPCRGRPSGRRGRTRRATMPACGLRPARRWVGGRPGRRREEREEAPERRLPPHHAARRRRVPRHERGRPRRHAALHGGLRVGPRRPKALKIKSVGAQQVVEVLKSVYLR